MAEKPAIRQYRIGAYAQKMGVTPDLLKHYERMGILQAQTTESGYRYYPFSESAPLLESFCLRNYDIPLQEIHELMYHGNLDTLHETLGTKAEAMRQHVIMEQAMIREYEALDRWLERMKNRSVYMLIEEQEETLFLPHSRRHDFLDDDRIQEVLPEWIAWMPVVRSCRTIQYQPDADCLKDAYWGLSVPASGAEAYGIPLNDRVERLKGGRHLVCHYLLNLSEGHTPNEVWGQVQQQLTRTGIVPTGPVRQTMYASLFAPENRIICGSYAVPMPD